ncbi:MAG TPA: hypothetical protein PKV73_16625 [Agriterribacter sp.]|nr:hypothetical protein [Agriterribacter sp.]
MPTSNQNNGFAQMLSDDCIDEVKLSRTALDNAIDWISQNLDPDDVFDSKQLSTWAENNGYVEKH